MIFRLCSFSCYNMVAKFLLSRLCLSCPCFRYLISALNALPWWSKLWWCMSPQKLFFCYHLPTRGRAGVKLGGAWYISNISIIFDAPCLFLHHLLSVLFTLLGIFMWFPELTYWQDDTVPVPYFLLFLCFRKATQEIFSELDETTTETPIFPGRRTRTKRELERGQRAASPWGGAAQALAAPTYGETSLVHLWRCPFAYKKPPNEKP
jgi:hypothetical protein